jgi:hypothetical protein
MKFKEGREDITTINNADDQNVFLIHDNIYFTPHHHHHLDMNSGSSKLKTTTFNVAIKEDINMKTYNESQIVIWTKIPGVKIVAS